VSCVADPLPTFPRKGEGHITTCPFLIWEFFSCKGKNKVADAGVQAPVKGILVKLLIDYKCGMYR
jgi:hypothetical protein